MGQHAPKFLIVYNADGGLFNMVADGIHKVVSPDTYPCSLCAVSYGLVSMHTPWRKYLKSLSYEVVFHHKDDFAEAYPGHEIALPAILVRKAGAMPEVLIGKDELDALEDVNELIALTQQRLAERKDA
ncbi:MAG: hypothetical protein R3360_08015, partial [Alphaproteobacteria bacterium]|nr:hypothetical protein [Alphaproteobacteria bacterium]